MEKIDRKNIKWNAKNNLKRNYIISVIVGFITVVVLGGGYYYTTNNTFTETQSSEVIENNDFIEKTNQSSSSDLVNYAFDAIFKKSEGEQIEEKENVGKGVLSGVINQFARKKVSIGVLNFISLLINNDKNQSLVLSGICTVLSILLFFLVKNVIVIGKIRYFLEQRRYNAKIGSILFPYKVKKTMHLSWILFCKYIFQALWDLTIIGGFIKYYEYIFIPYVLSENPNIKRKEAFRLSKELTKGQKWEIFKFDLGFLGWKILSIITLGLAEIFFVTPYEECAFAELYMDIRRKRMDILTDKDLLIDNSLDIEEVQDKEYPTENYNMYGIKTRKWLNIDYKRNYSIQNLILFFFIFSFIGYAYEVAIHLIEDGQFVNRGSLYGPWLPIYGFGGVLILVVLKRFREKPLLLFASAFVLCGVVEYIGAWMLETFKHIKYWDYSGYFFNIQGRVCLEGLLVFGLGGCVFTYLLGPILDNLCNKINPKVKNILCVVLLLIILGDYRYSAIHPNVGKGITDYPN